MTGSNKELRVRNWKLHAVRKKAANWGCQIKFVRKVFGPRHIQDRIYINGHRCHLMSGLGLNPNDSGDPKAGALRVPKSFWAEFLIYVPEPLAKQEQPFFIVPRGRLSAAAWPTADQLAAYADRWDFLKRTVAGRETPYSQDADTGAAEPNDRGREMIDSRV
jgi:hypothetical protein